jgi:hypothetical protein
MRVSNQTVANYEKGKTAELGPADPYMRWVYLLHIIPEETRAEVLKVMADKVGQKRLPDVPRRKSVQKWQEAA